MGSTSEQSKWTHRTSDLVMRPMLIIHSNIKSQTVICSFGMNMTGCKTWGLRYKQTFFKFAHFIHFQNSKMKTPKSCAESAICWQSLLVYHPSFFFFFSCQRKSDMAGIAVTTYNSQRRACERKWNDGEQNGKTFIWQKIWSLEQELWMLSWLNALFCTFLSLLQSLPSQ